MLHGVVAFVMPFRHADVSATSFGIDCGNRIKRTNDRLPWRLIRKIAFSVTLDCELHYGMNLSCSVPLKVGSSV